MGFEFELFNFKYIKNIARLAYEGRTSDGQRIVIKFAKRYGNEVHQFCFENGLAQNCFFVQLMRKE